jgi:hypothetical protein
VYSQSAEAGIVEGIAVYPAVTAPEPSRTHEIEFLAPAFWAGISYKCFFLLK